MPKISKKFLFAISFLVGVFLFILAFQQVGIKEVESALSLFPIQNLFIIFFANFVAAIILSGFRWYIISEAQGCRVKFIKIIQAKMAGFSVSYVTPAALLGGEPVRAYMLKEVSNCSWEKSFSSVLVDQMIFFISIFVSILLGFFMLLESFEVPSIITYSVIFVSFLAFILLYILYTKTLKRCEGDKPFFTFIIHTLRLNDISFIKRKLNNIEETDFLIEDFFKKHQKESVLAFLISFVEILIYAFTVFLICLFLGQNITFINALEIFVLITLANLVPIPGALGSFELFLTLVFHSLGLGKDTGLIFSLIFRFINVILCLAGMFVLFIFAFKTLSKKTSVEAPPIFLKIHSLFLSFYRKIK